MHDHLLGCHQFQAAEIHNEVRPFALGIPRRVKWTPAKIDRAAAAFQRGVIDFNEKDHTPAHMQADFPHEYDLHTMYGDAAKRAYAGLKVRDEAVPVSQLVSNWMKGEFDRACGVPEVKVMSCDYGRGDDMAAAIAFACAPYAKAVEETRAEIVARILADKQRLRPSKKPPALDL